MIDKVQYSPHAYHAKTKHIDVQYHFVRDMVEDKKVLLEKVDTMKNVVDSMLLGAGSGSGVKSEIFKSSRFGSVSGAFFV